MLPRPFPSQFSSLSSKLASRASQALIRNHGVYRESSLRGASNDDDSPFTTLTVYKTAFSYLAGQHAVWVAWWRVNISIDDQRSRGHRRKEKSRINTFHFKNEREEIKRNAQQHLAPLASEWPSYWHVLVREPSPSFIDWLPTVRSEWPNESVVRGQPIIWGKENVEIVNFLWNVEIIIDSWSSYGLRDGGDATMPG